MNRLLSGIVVSWRTNNARKMRKAEMLCADYGLVLIHKALHFGSLYPEERLSLERKFHHLLNGRRDSYCVIVLCAGCKKAFSTAHEIAENNITYEIV